MKAGKLRWEVGNGAGLRQRRTPRVKAEQAGMVGHFMGAVVEW